MCFRLKHFHKNSDCENECIITVMYTLLRIQINIMKWLVEAVCSTISSLAFTDCQEISAALPETDWFFRFRLIYIKKFVLSPPTFNNPILGRSFVCHHFCSDPCISIYNKNMLLISNFYVLPLFKIILH